MCAVYDIRGTHPGADAIHRELYDVAIPDIRTETCSPTVLDREHGREADEADARHGRGWERFEYAGACLGCGWISTPQPSENLGAEAAHEHTHPGFRELPTCEPFPAWTRNANPTGAKVKRWLAEQREFLTRLHPPGWQESHGPTWTRREPPGTRHVPGHGYFGGYDLARTAAKDDQTTGRGREQLALDF